MTRRDLNVLVEPVCLERGRGPGLRGREGGREGGRERGRTLLGLQSILDKNTS